MLTVIFSKIRALIEDFLTSDFEVFTYTNSAIFTLCESNITEIIKVLKNGEELGSGQWAYDSDINKVTITTSLILGDLVEVDFKFNKYSDAELKKYVEASLVWISVKAHTYKDFEIEDDDGIYPTPDNKTTDLIALIASFLIIENYNLYRLPNLTVRYPRNLSKEEKIANLIQQFENGLGVNDIISWS